MAHTTRYKHELAIFIFSKIQLVVFYQSSAFDWLSYWYFGREPAGTFDFLSYPAAEIINNYLMRLSISTERFM